MSFGKLIGITVSLLIARADPQLFKVEQDLHTNTTQVKKHPIVQGNANVINLEVRGNNDYTGHLYIGSEQRQTSMIYDTNSQWVVVNNEGLGGAELISNYDVSESTSAVAQYTDTAKNKPYLVNLDYGTVDFEGLVYTDNMCLYQTRNSRTQSSGRMCVRNMPFISVTKIIGDFEANGVIGLAPNPKNGAYVNQLFMQDQIKNKYVGLNFEDPEDNNSMSTITFGHFDYSQIAGGQASMRYYKNQGISEWSVIMDDVMYGLKDIEGRSRTSKIAIIDSGNTTIQLPETEFKQLRNLMIRQDTSVYIRNVNGKETLMSKKKCEKLYTIFDDLKFMIGDTLITIKPKGYLYKMDLVKEECFIGVQSIPDNFNQYRLGTIFLRNFYTGLDYENNLIILGVNKGTTSAYLTGEAPDPNRPRKTMGATIWVILFIITMIAISIALFVRQQKVQQKTVSFSHMSADEIAKRQGEYDELADEPEQLEEEENAAQNLEDEVNEEEEDQENAPVRAINDSVVDEDKEDLVQK